MTQPCNQRTHTHTLTTHKAAGRNLKDALSLQTFRVGAGGIDTDLQTTCHQPVGQPVELAVTQQAVALNETGGEGTDKHMSRALYPFLYL